MMTPLEIQIMLHCYCSDAPWLNMPQRIWTSEASRNARDMLKEQGLLDYDLRPTDSGTAFVESLCALGWQRMEAV
jgi:hypothetical protein